MSHKSQYKKKFDPELGRFTRQHIYGGREGVEGSGRTDIFKSFGKKIFGKTMKKAAKKGAEKALTSAATKTGEHVGKKAGDKIVQLLSKEKTPTPMQNLPVDVNPMLNLPVDVNPLLNLPVKKMTRQEVNQKVNSILSGGKLYNY